MKPFQIHGRNRESFGPQFVTAAETKPANQRSDISPFKVLSSELRNYCKIMKLLKSNPRDNFSFPQLFQILNLIKTTFYCKNKTRSGDEIMPHNPKCVFQMPLLIVDILESLILKLSG